MLVKTPERVLVTADQLRSLQPTPPAAYKQPTRNTSQSTFILEDFLVRHGLDFSTDRHDGRERFKLKACPFNGEHVNGEAAVFRDGVGKLGFKCMHDSCCGKNWTALREHLDGPGSPRAHSGNWNDWEDAATSGPSHADSARDTGRIDAWPELQPAIAKTEAQELFSMATA